MTEEEKRLQNQYAVNGDALYERLKSNKPTYAGTYDQQLSDMYNRLTNRPGFQYDVTKDPLYQQYKGQYIQQGKMAMKDTMGQAAGLTGGYGSSYGQQVGQQAYDAYLQKLGDVVPDLYNSAYQKYQNEGDDLLRQYSLLAQQRDDEYSRYRNELSDWENDRALQLQLENQQYSRQQDSYANLYKLIGSSGYNPTDDELAAAGMTREAADALRNEYLRANGLLNTGGYTYTPDPPPGGGDKYTLDDLAKDLASVKHGNQKEDFIRSYQEAMKNGMTTFTQAQLNKFLRDNHL